MSFGDTTTLIGRSGAKYVFTIFPRMSRFQPNAGVYVMGRQLEGQSYQFCYVGHAADLSIRPLQKDKTPCFDRFGVDHIFILEESDTNRRAQIAGDLIQAYTPACNAP